MFSFAYPKILYLLLLIPVYVGLYLWTRYCHKRNLKRFGRLSSLLPLMPEMSQYKAPLKICVQMAALALLIIAFARPWGGIRNQKTTKEGIEVVIAVDASNSMLASATADDNGTSRMRTAKFTLEKLITRLDNDRVGLIVYANNAYTLIPVTNDYVSARMFLNSIDPSQIEDQGTNMAAAINLAVNSFSDNKEVGKALILLTDAEELENKEEVMKAASGAARKGIQVDVVGVGSPSPVTIPEGDGVMIDYETGSPVRTALNEDLAADIAKAAKGIYVNAANKDALGELSRQLDSLKKAAMEGSTYSQHDELFAIFLAFAIVLMCADIFLLERKIGWLDKITFFRRDEK